MENKNKIILHLCASEYGSDTKDYREAGYTVIPVTEEIDVRKFEPPENVYGIIANPPCTMFSKARTVAKTPRDLMKGMELVIACLNVIWKCQSRIQSENQRTPPLKFWALENPDGMLKWFLGKPAFIFQPYEFGDNYSKKTNLWGQFNEPKRPFWNGHSIGGLVGGRSEKMSKEDIFELKKQNKENWNKKLTDVRSIASPYFTKAFFEANQ